MKKNILILIFCFSSLMTSCISTLPPEPSWQKISRNPFIEKIGQNYLVSDEYVKLSEQRRLYIERVRKYRENLKKH